MIGSSQKDEYLFLGRKNAKKPVFWSLGGLTASTLGR
jgi:hypothetical protein